VGRLRRVSGRFVAPGRDGDVDDWADDDTATASGLPAAPPMRGLAGAGLCFLDGTLRRPSWPATGAAGLICSWLWVVARPGLLLACAGSVSGLEAGASGGPRLATSSVPLPLIVRGGRLLGWCWSSLTSIIKLRLAMTGRRAGPSNMEVRCQAATTQPCWTAERMERGSNLAGNKQDRQAAKCGWGTALHASRRSTRSTRAAATARAGQRPGKVTQPVQGRGGTAAEQ